MPRVGLAASLLSVAMAIGGCSHLGPAGVQGSASRGTALTPALRQPSLAQPHSTGPAHVLTWMDIGANGGPNIDPTLVAKWVDYSIEDQPHSLIGHKLGIKTVLYTDPNRTGPGDIMHTNIESTYAHTCTNKRINVIGKDKQLMNVHSSILWTLWLPAVQQMIQNGGGGVYDYIFEDTADSIYHVNGTPCHFDQTSWTDDTNNLDRALGMPIIYNGLAHIGLGQETPAHVIKINPTTSGGEAEECYVGRTPTHYHFAPFWLGMENTELAMQQQDRVFACNGTVYTDPAKSVALRLYYYASFLLTYDLQTSVDETGFSGASGVSVMPEVQLVPRSPRKATPQTIDGLLEPSGVYGREYGSCYVAGAAIGPCAIAVNPNNPKAKAPMDFPWPGKYLHTLTMSGSDIYDGGTIGTNGPSPPAKMPGATAVIAFP